jgi:predicted enzyme related to lactoylglutathione lyase
MGRSLNGKICYLELPAADVAASAAFYASVFGWTLRRRGDGSQAFDDTTGAVSGAFVLDRSSWATPGLLFYIMVDDVAATCRLVEEKGGAIVQHVGVDAPEITARFRDPGGNVVGLYQEPPQATGREVK